MNILVLCTGNSARSILLELLLAHHGQGRINAYSAGSRPAGKVHPQSLAMLSAAKHDTAGFRSKSWDEFAADDAPTMDCVITVCGSAAAETCPIWPGAPVRAHWGVEDPAAATPDNIQAAFNDAFEILQRRTLAFLEKTPEKMAPERLRAHLVACGNIQ